MTLKPSRRLYAHFFGPKDSAYRFYDGLIDKQWYAARHPESANDPLRHYVDIGRHAMLAPNPYFHPIWYRSQYPDVAKSDLDPLRHYDLHGWRELRDPSPAFSTRHYLDLHPDIRVNGRNPLRHYLEFGRHERRSPHPLLEPLDITQPDIAIIVLSFNAPQALRVTLDSLARAKVGVPFTVYLIDNGSRPEVKTEVGEIVAGIQSRGLAVTYTDHPVNLGFSGGNNVCIKQALAKSHTHICILNSDVVVTENWLDYLIDTAEPVVGPVSNAVGNEQTVPIDYSVAMDEAAWPVVTAFAQKRREAYASNVVYSDFIGFFCALIRRDVVERVDLLDDRFFPGSYEDDDYCVRLQEAGYRLAIARNVYIHHFGSASFSMLDFNQRLQIGDLNRQRFEEKHGRPWLTRTPLLLTSWAQDEALSRGGDPASTAEALHLFTREAHHRSSVDLVRRLIDATEHFRREAARGPEVLARLDHRLSERVNPSVGWMREEIRRARATLLGEEVQFTREPHVHFGDPAQDVREASAVVQRTYAVLLASFWREIDHIEMMSFGVLTAAQPLLFAFADIVGGHDAIVIFAQIDPTHCDTRDGYAQRVLAIDSVLSTQRRIYVQYDDDFRHSPALQTLGDGRYLFRIANRAPLAEAFLMALGGLCRCYVHSVLRLSDDSTRRCISARPERTIFDVHGAVPEEFRMYDDPFSAQVHEAYEAFLFREAGRVICVSHAMADHLREKHGSARRPPVICPIFVEAPSARSQQRIYRDRARIVYAGGTQRWQQIPKMLDLVAAFRDRFDFTMYTPDPAMIRTELEARGVPNDGSVVNESVSPEAVQAALPNFDFGFLLREDSIVNRVSCPTKLIEYLLHGVIPIMEAAVGDFNTAGLRYVSVEDFRLGRLPDIQLRHEMAETNRQILAATRAAASDGLREICAPFSAVREAA